MRGSLAKGLTAPYGGASGTWKVSDYIEGLIRLPKGLSSIEWKVVDGFVLVISIIRWNQMYIGSTPWNNEPVTTR